MILPDVKLNAKMEYLWRKKKKMECFRHSRLPVARKLYVVIINNQRHVEQLFWFCFYFGLHLNSREILSASLCLSCWVMWWTNLIITCYIPSSGSFLSFINISCWPEPLTPWAGRESYWSNFYIASWAVSQLVIQILGINYMFMWILLVHFAQK